MSCFPYFDQYFSDSGSFWPIVIIVIVAVIVWTEYGSQDCRNQTCNNRSQPTEPSDTNSQMIDKIISDVRKNHTQVGWRRSMFVAIIATLGIILVLYRCTVVSGFVFFIIATFIFISVYFASAWFHSHWFMFNDAKIEQALLDLRHRLNEDII